MDMTAIFTVLEKGLTLLPMLVSAGVDIASTVSKLESLASSAKNGTVTADEVTQLETELDAQIADFNSDMPQS